LASHEPGGSLALREGINDVDACAAGNCFTAIREALNTQLGRDFEIFWRDGSSSLDCFAVLARLTN
jgi:hypothetical protein